jgi:hypothetical protein
VALTLTSQLNIAASGSKNQQDVVRHFLGEEVPIASVPSRALTKQVRCQTGRAARPNLVGGWVGGALPHVPDLFKIYGGANQGLLSRHLETEIAPPMEMVA